MNTISTKRQEMVCALRDKEYRDAFVAAEVSITLPFQIKANREARKWNQAKLAEESGQAQPTISRMERPGYDKFTLTTLRRLASAFDCALLVRLVPFSQLIEWADQVSPEELTVSAFDADAGISRLSVHHHEPKRADDTDIPSFQFWTTKMPPGHVTADDCTEDEASTTFAVGNE